MHLIENALAEAEVYSLSHASGQGAIADAKKVLLLLNEAIKNDPSNISVRVLRAMHDVGMSAFKDFENTQLENALDNVTTMLYNEIPFYKVLDPLRGDFGKGNPI